MKVENAIFRDFFVFDPSLQMLVASQVRANIVVVGKPIPTFPIAVHWSDFDISSGVVTNRLNIAEIAIFVGGSGQGHVTPHNFVSLIKGRVEL